MTNVIRRSDIDATHPGGPVERGVEYVIPLRLANYEQDNRVAWAPFEQRSKGDAA